MIKPYNRTFGAMENIQTRLRLLEMHPLWCWRTTFPPEGDFALHSAHCFLCYSMHNAANISPSGGDVAEGDRRGAFPSPVRAVVWF
jgi:hypothetical protein